jgi:photosystem II stability/assembly factor-like uncharacterized protein
MKKPLLLLILITSCIANAQFWSEKATGFTTAGRGIYYISIVDQNVVWALGVDHQVGNDDLTIKEFTRSNDGGNTWTPGKINLGAGTVTPADLGVSSITAVSNTTAWISVYPDEVITTEVGGIWKTTDSGLTWTKQTTALFNGGGSYANFVHFWDANNGIAAGDPENGEFEIYTTNDGGNMWTRIPATNIPNPNGAGEYGIFNRFVVTGNTIRFGTNSGRIYKSTDKGLNWTVAQSQSANFTQDRFAFSDDTRGLLTIYQDPILLYRTSDGGTTWNPVTATGTLHTDIVYIPGTSIAVATDYKIPAGSTNSILGSSYSLDNGTNWTAIDGIPHGTVKFLNTSFGFSGGFNANSTTGGIFKFTGIPLKNPNFDSNNHISAYPNPTNGTIYLNSETSLIKEASVFDLLGKQVYKSNFSALNNVSLDLKSLQSGVYLLKVTSDSGETETMKIMKN